MKYSPYLLLLFPLFVFAQGDVYLKTFPSPKIAQPELDEFAPILDKFLIQGRVLSFVTVIDAADLSKEQIRQNLIAHLSSDARVSLDQLSISADLLTGSLRGFKIDYLKFGQRRFDIANWAYYPLDAEFVVQIRPGRYKVLIKEMTMILTDSTTINLSSNFVNDEGKLTEINRKPVKLSYYIMGKGIEDLFALQKFSEW